MAARFVVKRVDIIVNVGILRVPNHCVDVVSVNLFANNVNVNNIYTVVRTPQGSNLQNDAKMLEDKARPHIIGFARSVMVLHSAGTDLATPFLQAYHEEESTHMLKQS